MATLTPRSTRTITGYASQLLEYPRWYIERDIDFSNCQFHGVFQASAGRCVACEVGSGCLWLNRKRSPTVDEASLTDLIDALETAVAYVRNHTRHEQPCDCETCRWIHEARALLRSRAHWT